MCVCVHVYNIFSYNKVQNLTPGTYAYSHDGITGIGLIPPH